MRRDPRYKYLRNANPGHLEVHDLDNEKTGPFECQISEIIAAGHGYYLNANNVQELRVWLSQNPSYDGCRYCLPQFDRK